jgi:integrase
VTLPAKHNLGASSIRSCALVLNAVVNDAVKAGRLPRSNIKGLNLPALVQKTEITFATQAQIENLAALMPEPYGFTIYLMRGCGVRLGEALGVFRSDMSGGSLRLKRQLAPTAMEYTPLKHRDADDYRDIPLPGYVTAAMPEEWMTFPEAAHRTYRTWFNRARDAAGLPADFTPHTLRHQFASVCLAGGIPITDVSKWLGHRSIQVTYGIYGHLVPASWDRARNVLDEEWAA